MNGSMDHKREVYLKNRQMSTFESNDPDPKEFLPEFWPV